VDIMARNIGRAAQMCRAAGVGYRPHAKTHKIPALAHQQVQAGAIGITCAKIGEAEVMARGGLRDIFIAYPVVACSQFHRLAVLSTSVNLSVGVDSLDVAKAMSQFCESQRVSFNILLEVDTGHRRCGVIPERAEEVAEILVTLSGLRLKGVFTHEGQVYLPGPQEQRLALANEAGRALADVGRRLMCRGFSIETVSVGSSPALDAACRAEGVTENRPGTNIFNDGTQVHLGACRWEDCALTYYCTVVSRPAPDRAIIDGGSKTFSSDRLSDWPHYGAIVGYPEIRFTFASEEHGILTLEGDCARALKIGDRIRIIPSHACGSINLHDHVYLTRGADVVDELKVEARGCVR
jgi:D-serine deaminase-like pyridoxal phosphate-dependent protein